MSVAPVTKLSVEADPSGHAVVVLYNRPASVVGIRILRKATTAPTGPTDSGATVLYDGPGEPRRGDAGGARWYCDVQSSTNVITHGTTYHYSIWAFDGTRTYSAVKTASVVPGASAYTFDKHDAKAWVIQRLKDGLKDLITSGSLRLKSGRADVQVYSASPWMLPDAIYPCVSVHLDNQRTDEEYIGHRFDEGENPHASSLAGAYESVDAHFIRHSLMIIGHSADPGERDRIRDAIDSVLLANTEISESAGYHDTDWTLADSEGDPTEDQAPFKARLSFDCRTLTARIEASTTVEGELTLAHTTDYQDFGAGGAGA